MALALLVSTVSFAQKPKAHLDRNAQMKVERVSAQDAKYFKSELSLQQKSMPTTISTTATRRAAEPVVLPEGAEPQYYILKGTNSRGNAETTRTVKVAFDGDDVYISGLSWYVESAYVKGTFANDSVVVFPMGQYFGNPGADLYFAAYGDGAPDDAYAIYDGEANQFTFPQILLDNQDPAEGLGFYAYWKAGLTVTAAGDDVDLPVEPPTDLVTTDYVYTAWDYGFGDDDTEVSKTVKVGFYGDEVYVQGLCDYLPEAWVKGTIEGNQATFAAGQYFGKYRNTYDLFLIGYGDAGLADIVWSYDEATGNFAETDQNLAINMYKDKIDRSIFTLQYGVELKKIVEKAATPANPSIANISFLTYGDVLEFSLAVVDTLGEGMVADKLYYQVYHIDEMGNEAPVTFTKDLYKNLEEDIDMIPATFNDNYDFLDGELYLNMDHESWEKIGLKTIYKGGGETHESEIVWYTITWPQTVTVPEGAVITKNTLTGTEFDNEDPYTTTVNVAVVADSLFIQGFSTDMPNGWIKGVKNAEGKYEFANGQELGSYSSYRMFLIGYDAATSSVVTPVISVDEAKGVYTFETEFVANAGYTDRLYYLQRIEAGTTIAIKGETGITVAKSDVKASNGALYNLAGQRVGKDYKGLVVKDGKKFIMK